MVEPTAEFEVKRTASRRRAWILGGTSVLLLAGVAALVSTHANSSSDAGAPMIRGSEALSSQHRSEIQSNTVEFDLTNLKGGKNGKIVVDIKPEWAPIGAKRFKDLVKDHYFDNEKFFRAIPGFIVQFGLNGDPQETAKWQKIIHDDKVKHSNVAGTLVYATAGPETRTTQLFFNSADNSDLDGQGFAPFAKIVEGADLLNLIRAHPDEDGPDQGRVQNEGDAYLNSFHSNNPSQDPEFTSIAQVRFV